MTIIRPTDKEIDERIEASFKLHAPFIKRMFYCMWCGTPKPLPITVGVRQKPCENCGGTDE